jgi:hypothetical protein
VAQRERASLAWKRSGVRFPSGPPTRQHERPSGRFSSSGPVHAERHNRSLAVDHARFVVDRQIPRSAHGHGHRDWRTLGHDHPATISMGSATVAAMSLTPCLAGTVAYLIACCDGQRIQPTMHEPNGHGKRTIGGAYIPPSGRLGQSSCAAAEARNSRVFRAGASVDRYGICSRRVHVQIPSGGVVGHGDRAAVVVWVLGKKVWDKFGLNLLTPQHFESKIRQ